MQPISCLFILAVDARLSALSDTGSGEEEMDDGDPTSHSRGQSSVHLSCLDQICSLLSREPQVLTSLMQTCNLEGFTPFMSAVFQKVRLLKVWSHWLYNSPCNCA